MKCCILQPRNQYMWVRLQYLSIARENVDENVDEITDAIGDFGQGRGDGGISVYIPSKSGQVNFL